jgi:ubiquinone/menaquinone biosynthesis C-methylase UbiE
VAEDFLKPELIGSSLGLKTGMTVADFGCGSGEFTIYAAKLVGPDGHVTALDVRQEPLDMLASKAKALSVENITCVRANLEVHSGSKLSADSQDHVMLHNILFQSQKKEDIIKEAHRVLKKGGHLSCIDWKKGVKGFGPPENLRIAPEAALSLLEAAGFHKHQKLDAGRFHFGYSAIK